MRRDGVTVDSLVAVTGVTADGRIVRASAEEEPELFWGVRGAGSNFLVVTSFEFDLRPLGPDVTAGMVIHPADNADEVIRHWRDYMDDAPEAVGSMLMVMRAAEPLFPPEVAGQPVIGFMVVHIGTPEEAQGRPAAAAGVGEPARRRGRQDAVHGRPADARTELAAGQALLREGGLPVLDRGRLHRRGHRLL